MRRFIISIAAFAYVFSPAVLAQQDQTQYILDKIKEFGNTCVNGSGADAIDKCTRLIKIYTTPGTPQSKEQDMKLFLLYAVRSEHLFKARDVTNACFDAARAMQINVEHPMREGLIRFVKAECKSVR